MTNPYKVDTSNFTEEQWDKILGKWVEKEVPKSEFAEVWKLIDSKRSAQCVVDSGGSLAACHETYLIDDVRYVCYWSYHQLENVNEPFMIAIQTRRGPMAKQLELFENEDV